MVRMKVLLGPNILRLPCGSVVRRTRSRHSDIHGSLFGGPTEFLATRGPRNATDPRSESGEDWIELLNYVPFSADHHAVTTFQSPDAAACAHVDIMNSFRGQFLCATNVIDVVRIAAVDDRVARFQWFGKCRDGFFSRRTGWEHDPEGARCAELFNEFLERVGRRWTFFRECINVFPVSVEHNALVRRRAMFPPILPRPIIPICIFILLK